MPRALPIFCSIIYMECAAGSFPPLSILIEQLPDDLTRSIHRITSRLPTVFQLEGGGLPGFHPGYL